MDKMNSEIKPKWIEALRSGEYKQCRGFIHRGNAYCCLGVLHEVIGVNWKASHKDGDVQCYLPYDESRYTPAEAKLSIKVSTELQQMNDSGSSFEEIAEYIRLNL